MTRTITVKGIGQVSSAPDTVVISFDLESRNMNYEDTMEQAAQKNRATQ